MPKKQRTQTNHPNLRKIAKKSSQNLKSSKQIIVKFLKSEQIITKQAKMQTNYHKMIKKQKITLEEKQTISIITKKNRKRIITKLDKSRHIITN